MPEAVRGEATRAWQQGEAERKERREVDALKKTDFLVLHGIQSIEYKLLLTYFQKHWTTNSHVNPNRNGPLILNCRVPLLYHVMSWRVAIISISMMLYCIMWCHVSCRIQKPNIPRTGQGEKAHGEAAERGGAGQDGNPTVRTRCWRFGLPRWEPSFFFSRRSNTKVLNVALRDEQS